jgi:hypothetical protein
MPEAPGRACCTPPGVRAEAGVADATRVPRQGRWDRLRKIKVEGETLWVPTAWDARAFDAHERPVFRELKIIRPGSTV